MKNLPSNILYIFLGLSLGVSGTFYYINPKFEMLEQDSLQLSRISFLRGCTQNNTLETCKKHPGYSDNHEIFEKIEGEITQDIMLNFSNFLAPKDPKALNISGEDQRELQKMIQGRYENKFQI